MRLGADKLLATVAGAGYWQEWGHKKSTDSEVALLFDNAVNHWKNAAYHYAEEFTKAEARIATLEAELLAARDLLAAKEKEQEGKLLVDLEWLDAHAGYPVDYACAQCDEGGGDLIEGFVCMRHRINAALKARG